MAIFQSSHHSLSIFENLQHTSNLLKFSPRLSVYQNFSTHSSYLPKTLTTLFQSRKLLTQSINLPKHSSHSLDLQNFPHTPAISKSYHHALSICKKNFQPTPTISQALTTIWGNLPKRSTHSGYLSKLSPCSLDLQKLFLHSSNLPKLPPSSVNLQKLSTHSSNLTKLLKVIFLLCTCQKSTLFLYFCLLNMLIIILLKYSVSVESAISPSPPPGGGGMFWMFSNNGILSCHIPPPCL